MAGPQQKKKVLIVVRTYPTPAKKGVEVSCTAGVTDRGEWIRLFPVPYRFLDNDKRFRKYQWIDVLVQKASDPRPESYTIFIDTIQIISEPLSTTKNWEKRKKILSPLMAHCLCCLKRERDQNSSPTLGFFRPKIIRRLHIQDDKVPNWTQEQLQMLSQGLLFEKGHQADLEKVPHKFKYEFECDHDTCEGHSISCTDWEMGQSWRSWKQKYGNEWEKKFRQRYESEMISKYDTHFFVGTIHGHPANWLIVGLFYPPRINKPEIEETLPLFV